MKKLFLIMFVCAMFCACTSKTVETEVEATDTVATDTVAVDSVAIDSVAVCDTIK